GHLARACADRHLRGRSHPRGPRQQERHVRRRPAALGAGRARGRGHVPPRAGGARLPLGAVLGLDEDRRPAGARDGPAGLAVMLREDLRHAMRLLLRRHGGVRLPAILILALGVGANTALFAVAYGVLLRPLPWPDADRLVRLSESHPGGRTVVPKILLSNVTYEAWSPAPRTIEGIGAWSASNCTVSFAGEPERVRGAALSPAMFGLLRARPLLG